MNMFEQFDGAIGNTDSKNCYLECQSDVDWVKVFDDLRQQALEMAGDCEAWSNEWRRWRNQREG